MDSLNTIEILHFPELPLLLEILVLFYAIAVKFTMCYRVNLFRGISIYISSEASSFTMFGHKLCDITERSVTDVTN